MRNSSKFDALTVFSMFQILVQFLSWALKLHGIIVTVIGVFIFFYSWGQHMVKNPRMSIIKSMYYIKSQCHFILQKSDIFSWEFLGCFGRMAFSWPLLSLCTNILVTWYDGKMLGSQFVVWCLMIFVVKRVFNWSLVSSCVLFGFVHNLRMHL